VGWWCNHRATVPWLDGPPMYNLSCLLYLYRIFFQEGGFLSRLHGPLCPPPPGLLSCLPGLERALGDHEALVLRLPLVREVGVLQATKARRLSQRRGAMEVTPERAHHDPSAAILSGSPRLSHNFIFSTLSGHPRLPPHQVVIINEGVIRVVEVVLSVPLAGRGAILSSFWGGATVLLLTLVTLPRKGSRDVCWRMCQ
jgi:hypothetical protein